LQLGQDYVDYKFRLLKGGTSGNGPNPEDSVVKTSRYRNQFSDRWVHDGTQITVGDASGVDILDRDKFQFKPGVFLLRRANGRATPFPRPSDWLDLEFLRFQLRGRRDLARDNGPKLQSA
jgi:hypothetical protein